MSFTIDASWAAGLLFAMSRMAGFVVASPIFSKTLPAAARLAFALAVSLWFAGSAPPAGDLGVADLIGSAFSNVAVGVVLAVASGILFYLFETAGGLIDMMSGLQIAQVFDPTTGRDAAVFGRFFHMTALTIFLSTGGDGMLIRGLHRSLEAVPLTGGFGFSGGLAEQLLASTGTLLLAGIEVAAPALVALFLAEIVLAIAARFSPQTNVFILGMPIKILVALVTSGTVLALFPGAVDATIGRMGGAFSDALRILAP